MTESAGEMGRDGAMMAEEVEAGKLVISAITTGNVDSHASPQIV